MKAMVLDRFGPISHFSLRDILCPVPQNGQVLISVNAASINPIDVKTRIGRGAANWFRIQLPTVLGWDVSGTIAACGPNVTQWSIGDEVFGSINFPGMGQTNAEFTVAAATAVVRSQIVEIKYLF